MRHTPPLAECQWNLASMKVHMEEERVEVKVEAEEEEEIRDTHGREQSEENRREQTVTQAHDTWVG